MTRSTGFGKIILLLLLLAPLFFANTYGPSQIAFEKTWTVKGQPGTYVELDGVFIVNNTYQKVVSIEKAADIKLVYEKDGPIKVRYNGTMDSDEKNITARAVVDTLFKPDLPPDISFVITPADKGTLSNYTVYNDEIMAKARELADTGTKYGTIRNITAWVNGYITYDLNYFGKNLPAQTVFKKRRGVCVEYSHLTLSLMKVLGLKTRYVSGYVYSRDWQPHAWVEVLLDNGQWLPVDSTFGEIETLDNSHLAMFYSDDQGGVMDKIVSNHRVSFDYSERVSPVSMEKTGDPPAAITHSFDMNTETFTVGVNNLGNQDVFVAYSFLIPEEAGKGERTLLLLRPGEKRTFTYGLNPGYIQEGYTYNIPVVISLNDIEAKEDLRIEKKAAPTPEQKQQESDLTKQAGCGALFLLLAVGAVVWMTR